MELGKNLPNSTTAATTDPMSRVAASATQFLAGDVAGVPIAIVACTIAAAILGGIVAVTAGG